MSALKGRVLAITRSKKEAREFTSLVEADGGTAIALPTIEIVPSGAAAVAQFTALLCKGRHDYCAFMSAQAVKVLAEMTGRDQVKKALGHTSVIAIGPKTKKEIEKLGVVVDLVPQEFSTNGLVTMLSESKPAGKKIIIPRSAAADNSAAKALRSLGMQVDEVMLYTVRASRASQEWKKFAVALRDDRIDAIIFTSASSVESFFKILGKIGDSDVRLDRSTIIVSIGPFTTERLKKRNVECFEAKLHTVRGAFELAKKLLTR